MAENDDLWDFIFTPFNRLVAKLPSVFTRGSVIIHHGIAHFKGSPVDKCPKCGKVPTFGTTTLTFRYAPVESQTQTVQGWICECGEKYVPGEIAKQAHHRAFHG
jgi:hypothetical protein